MKRLFVPLALALLTVGAGAGTVSAGKPKVDLIRNFPSVLAVRPPTSPDFPLASLMRVNCRWLARFVKLNGTSIETQKCVLSDEPVMIPEFQGVVPDRRVHYRTGPCTWHSDYWWYTNESDVMALWAQVLVTPRGEVFVTSAYSRKPLDCPEPPAPG